MTLKNDIVLTNEENSLENARKMLLSFGLSDSESKVYIYLLERGGEIGGSKIAIGAKLHRQYVYLALPRLIQLGLVDEIPHGKLSKYKANAPIEIEKIAKKRVVEAEDLVKELQKFSKVGHEQDFEVVQGSIAVRKYEMEYARIAQEGSEEYIIGGSSKNFEMVMDEDLEPYLQLKKKRNIGVKYIGSENEKSLYEQFIGKYQNQEYRFLKKLPTGVTHMVIKEHSVSFYSFLNPPLIYIIKSETVARNYKDFFMMLWGMAEESN